MTRICFAQAVEGKTTQFLQTASLFLFQGPATLKEAGEVLRIACQPDRLRCRKGARTRALAMLAFSRFKSVVTPMSEYRTSCTRCCVCVSWGGAGCTGDAGVGASMGETGSSLSFGPAVLLKSGLKLSLLAIGGMDGGAAILGVVDLDVEVAVIRGHDQRGCRIRLLVGHTCITGASFFQRHVIRASITFSHSLRVRNTQLHLPLDFCRPTAGFYDYRDCKVFYCL